MNESGSELVLLYEAMHTCVGSEADRTAATRRLEEATRKFAKDKRLDDRLVMRHVKECYFQKIRAEDQRGDKRPLIKD